MDTKGAVSVDEIRRLVKSACKPVAMLPEFRKRLLRLLMRQVEVGGAAKGKTHGGGCETKNKGL